MSYSRLLLKLVLPFVGGTLSLGEGLRVHCGVVGFTPGDEHFKVEDSSADEVPAIVVRFFFFL